MVFEAWDHTLSTLEAGVEAVWRCAVDPRLDGVSGRYFDVPRESRADAQAYDPAARARLWELSTQIGGVPGPEATCRSRR
ncbi:MAG: hypothetical protein ACLPYS_16260 [Vulcanimicrobiaceae bacterium]